MARRLLRPHLDNEMDRDVASGEEETEGPMGDSDTSVVLLSRLSCLQQSHEKAAPGFPGNKCQTPK